jgi:hypothetical protein
VLLEQLLLLLGMLLHQLLGLLLVPHLDLPLLGLVHLLLHELLVLEIVLLLHPLSLRVLLCVQQLLLLQVLPFED